MHPHQKALEPLEAQRLGRIEAALRDYRMELDARIAVSQCSTSPDAVIVGYLDRYGERLFGHPTRPTKREGLWRSSSGPTMSLSTSSVTRNSACVAAVAVDSTTGVHSGIAVPVFPVAKRRAGRRNPSAVHRADKSAPARQSLEVHQLTVISACSMLDLSRRQVCRKVLYSPKKGQRWGVIRSKGNHPALSEFQ